jgi:CelD/BcsL family acetyltransferase involved in cellulose biosynthesis
MPKTDVSSPVAPGPSRHEQLLAQRVGNADPAATDLQVLVLESLTEAEPSWRALEERAVLTPYQRYDWIEAYVAARGLEGGSVAIAVSFSKGRPVALLPLLVTRTWGISRAEPIGAASNNAGWMIVDPDFAPRLDRPQLEAIFAEIGKTTGADLVAIYSQPAEWQGVVNPLLAFPHQPAPDHLYAGPLSKDKLSTNRTRNIQRGKRRLSETMGTVCLKRATTRQEIDLYHAAFQRQRSARFAEMGVGNIFAEDWFVNFFKGAAGRSLDAERPTLRFHALFAGDEILATAVGTYSGNHYSQYINSTATEGPAVKYSLIGILLHELIEELQREGITTIDIGLGDFAYKELWTDRVIVHDSVIPLSGKGRLAAPLLLGLRRLKRTIKQNRRVFELAKRFRALTLRRGDPDRHGKS